MKISKEMRDLLAECKELPEKPHTFYCYPEKPFLYGYSIPNHKLKFFSDKKPLWISGPLGDKRTALLEKFMGRPWEKDTSNINNLADVILVADESITKGTFLGLLKSKLRRCCNIQNPDLLTWGEIFTAINEYLSSEQKNGGRTKGKTKSHSVKKQKTPQDLITLCVAVKEYHVSRATLKRLIKNKQLHSYRPAKAPKNSPHIVSRAEIESRYSERQQSLP